MRQFLVALSFVFSLVFLVNSGCSSHSGKIITRDTTSAHPQSPYKSYFTAKTREVRDTTLIELSDGVVAQVNVTERCIYQEIVLKAKNKLHMGNSPISHIRFQDNDCEPPPSTEWESIIPRSADDRRKWARNRKEVREARMNAMNYLAEAYVFFPILNHVYR